MQTGIFAFRRKACAETAKKLTVEKITTESGINRTVTP